MKIIVVDDNKLSLKEICTTLKKINADIKIVKEFSNGKEALDYIKLNDVDVVISDVQMPVMNGNELIEEINKLNPSIKVVFISCYDEFPLIQSALQNRAFDYLLKPVGDVQCAKVIRKICEEFEKEKRGVNKKIMIWGKEQFLYKLLTSINIPENYIEILSDIGIPVSSEFTVIDVKYTEVSAEQSNVFEIIKSEFYSFCDETVECCFVEISLKEHVVLCFGELDTDVLMDYIIALQNNLPKNIRNRIAFGISNSYYDISKLKQAYNEANTASGYTIYSSKNRVIQYETVAKLKNAEVSVSAVLKDLKKIVDANIKEEINFFIDKYLDEKSYFNEIYVKNFTYCLIFSLENILNEKGASLESIDGVSIWDKIEKFDDSVNIKIWIYNIISSAFDVLGGDKHLTKVDIVNAIKRIIENDYGKRITMKEISEKLHYSTKYLSVLFNEIEGCSVSAYLTQFRMEKAKELLMNSDIKIHKIMEMVGYKKPTGFTKAFKDYTGFLPSEYKDMLKKRS